MSDLKRVTLETFTIYSILFYDIVHYILRYSQLYLTTYSIISYYIVNCLLRTSHWSTQKTIGLLRTSHCDVHWSGLDHIGVHHIGGLGVDHIGVVVWITLEWITLERSRVRAVVYYI